MISNRKSFFYLLSLSVLGSSCSKKINPDTSLNRNDGSGDLQGQAFDDTGNGFSPAGSAFSGNLSDDDLLVPRNPGLEAFSDPLNVIRPFDPVFFGFDQYNLTASERPKLAEIAEFLKANQEANLLIEGYCDWKGTPAYNKALGERRARSVRDYLVDLGADELRIETVSIGDETAIPNADGTQAKLDRRASFVVSKGN